MADLLTQDTSRPLGQRGVGPGLSSKPSLEKDQEESLPSSGKAEKLLLPKFLREIQFQLGIQQGKRDQWKRWLLLYNAKPSVKKKIFPWPEASNIVVGLIGIYVDSVVARVMQSVFSNEPHWVGTQLNRKWADAVDPLVRYLDWVRQYVWDQYHVVKQVVLEMCKLGTAILYNGWQDQPLFRWNADTQQTVENGRNVGPCPSWIPREDFLIPEGYTDIDCAPWIATRWWFSKQDVMKYTKSGFFSVDEQSLDKINDTEDRIRQQELTDSVDPAPTGLICVWQVWFAEDMDNDGFPEEHIIWLHLNTKKLWRYEANPYLYGLRPFVKFTFVEQEGQFDGMGVAEMCEQYQDETSTIHNQRRDNATIANVRGAVARRGSGISSDQKLYPGVILFAADPKDIVPFQLGEVYPSSQTDEQITKQLAEQRVGVNDVNQGQITPPIGRATATTVMSQLQEGTRRFDLNTSELRRGLSTQAMQVCELYQTHGLPAPDEANSPEQVLDEQDAAAVRAVFSQPDQIKGLIALKLNVSTAAVNKEIEKQSSMQLMQMVMGYYQQMLQILPQMFNPQLQQQMPQMQAIILTMVKGADRMIDLVFKSYQRFDLEDVLLMPAIEGEENANAAPGGPGPNPMAPTQGQNPSPPPGPPGNGNGFGQLGAIPGLQGPGYGT